MSAVKRVLGLKVGRHPLITWIGLLVGHLRGLLPLPVMKAVVELRTRLAWRNEAVRDNARREMALVLEHTRPDADLDAVAREYVRRQALRGELRWHDSLVDSMTLEGLDNLAEAKALGRGVVLCWMHHGILEGTSMGAARRGLLVNALGAPKLFGDLPAWLVRHNELAQRGGHRLIPADAGVPAFLDLLKNGEILSIAMDVPGRTPVRFLGRDLIGSFGAPRMAMEVGAPVVVLTSELRDKRDLLPTATYHPALMPEDFEDARALHARMLEICEPTLVKDPEIYDIPSSHWGIPDETADSAPGEKEAGR